MVNPAISHRAVSWQLRTRSLVFTARPLVMGIVNVTPDSFSDGGRWPDAHGAVAHAQQLVADGADLLDIGGESTRPGAAPVPAEEEIARVLPVIEQLAAEVTVPISIDTRKAAVAAAALEAGAEIVNDVSGLNADPQMVAVAAATGAAVCVMHMQGTPATMQLRPSYRDVVGEVYDYLQSRRDALLASGIPIERICLDPGIGFGKTAEHNWELLRHCDKLHMLGCPLLVGHSRKRFLGQLVGDETADRLPATLGVALWLASQRVQILRVHDVRPLREALLAFAAAGGIAGDGCDSGPSQH